METEYSSYRLGLLEKRAGWLVAWLREKSWAGNVTAKKMAQDSPQSPSIGRGPS